MTKEIKIYAYREHDKEKTKDFITIRTSDWLFRLDIPREEIEKALKEFETGEEINFNY